MKKGLICNVPVSKGEITVIRGDSAGDIMKHSCELARTLRSAGEGVLVVNTGLSKRRFKEAAGEAGIEVTQIRDTNTLLSAGRVPIIIQTSVAGELSSELDMVRTICQEAKIRFVIITGWEWTSSSYRRKEQLIYGLRQLLDDLDIALVVYSQSPGVAKAGQYARGGVGKLAMIADEIADLETIKSRGATETDLDVFVEAPKPEPVIGGGEQLSSSEINELQPVFAESNILNSLTKIPAMGKAKKEYATAA